MKKNEIIAIILFFLATVGTVVGVFAIEKFRLKKFYTQELIARTPEHGNWYPKTIVVPYGKKVRLLIRNIDTVTHGFSLPAFRDQLPRDSIEISAGHTEVVEFVANKKGTFPFMCTVWCSPNHMQMRGELIVK